LLVIVPPSPGLGWFTPLNVGILGPGVDLVTPSAIRLVWSGRRKTRAREPAESLDEVTSS